ncbi:MAG: molybdopterin-binding protein [Myxococcota bacterium]|nr:molybdopterin-binding protein [Myxococcota bacterium]
MAAAHRVAVVIIGDEILEGSTVDTNSTTLIRWANSQGHRVVSVQTVSDRQEVIVETLRRARHDGATIIITTGGVGPTIDDLTVESVGRSLGIDDDHELPEMLEALRGWIGEEPQGVRRRTARVPVGTSVLFPKREDGSRGWPIFCVGDTYCLPGIPRLVAKLLPLLPPGPGERPFAKVRFQGYETQGAQSMEAVASQYPLLDFGSYPPTQSGDDWVSLTVRGAHGAPVHEAAQALLVALRQEGLLAEWVSPKSEGE